jgi:hypothetical protein
VAGPRAVQPGAARLAVGAGIWIARLPVDAQPPATGLVADDGQRQCLGHDPQRARRTVAGANRPGSQRVKNFTRLGGVADLSAGARSRAVANLSHPAAAVGIPQPRRDQGQDPAGCASPLWGRASNSPYWGSISARSGSLYTDVTGVVRAPWCLREPVRPRGFCSSLALGVAPVPSPHRGGGAAGCLPPRRRR